MTPLEHLEIEVCSRDCHTFIFGQDGHHFLYTVDEQKTDAPVRPFPDIPYLRCFVDCLLVSGGLLGPQDAKYAREWGAPMAFLVHLAQKRQFFTEKSRQVMATWVIMAYICWRAKFFEHQLIMVQSKKAEDAEKLVCTKRGEPLNARLTFMEAKLPPHLQSIPADSPRATKGKVTYPNASQVVAIPEGSGQIRSYVPSVFFSDEAAFQPQFGGAYRAAKPLIANGCQGVFVSSAEVGPFQELVESDLHV